MRGVGIYDLAVNLGTSVFYIERTYSHITAMMKSKELTKGPGYWKVIEQGGQLKELEQANEEPSIRDEQNL